MYSKCLPPLMHQAVCFKKLEDVSSVSLKFGDLYVDEQSLKGSMVPTSFELQNLPLLQLVNNIQLLVEPLRHDNTTPSSKK